LPSTAGGRCGWRKINKKEERMQEEKQKVPNRIVDVGAG
jgi:hypothetical protein